MIAHEETLAGKHGVAAQKYETMSNLMHVIGDSIAGKALKGMGGLVLSGAQFGAHLSMMGIKIPALTKAMAFMMRPINGIISGLGSMVSWIGKAIAKMIGLKAVQSSTDVSSIAGPLTKAGLPDKRFKANKTPAMAATPTPAAPGGDPAGQANKFGKIKMGDVLKAAVALLILAAALFVFAKAANAFGNDINWENVFIGIAAMALLGVVAGVLGLFGVMILAGAGALLIASAAFYVFGLAAQQVAIGISMFGDALSKIDVGQMALFGLALIPLGLGLAFFGFLAGPILIGAGALMLLGLALSLVAPNMAILGTIMPTITSSLTGLITIIPQVLLLAVAISALAWSLAMLGTMGLLALPILAAMSGGNGLLNILGLGKDSGGGSSDKLLEEIVGLRADLNSGKVSVYLDGKKVNTQLASNERRNK